MKKFIFLSLFILTKLAYAEYPQPTLENSIAINPPKEFVETTNVQCPTPQHIYAFHQGCNPRGVCGIDRIWCS